MEQIDENVRARLLAALNQTTGERVEKQLIALWQQEQKTLRLVGEGVELINRLSEMVIDLDERVSKLEEDE